jgi:hypothetical protein
MYGDMSSFALFTKDRFCYLGPFVLPYEFQDWFFYFYENYIEILMEIVLNL